MKAVIVDFNGQRAAALCEDGSVRDIENIDYCLGQTIFLDEKDLVDEKPEDGRKRFKIRKLYRRIAAAAAMIMMLAGAGGVSVYAMPYAEVSLDAGSSVTYTINRFDYVIDAEASDEDGLMIIEEVGKENLVNKKIESAVALTIDHIQEDNLSATDVEYCVRTDISRGGSSADEAHARKLREKLEKVIADKVPVNTDPEETNTDTEGNSVLHPDRESLKDSEQSLKEPATEGSAEKTSDSNTIVLPEDGTEPQPENRSEEKVEEKQENEPVETGSAPVTGADDPGRGEPQTGNENPPDGRSEEPFENTPGAQKGNGPR